MPYRKKITATKSAGLLILIFLFYSCNSDENKIPPPNVSVTNVVQRDVTIYEEFVGQTYGYSDIAIRARVDGFLEGIHFSEGMPVKKGQLLYSIDPQPFQAKVAEAMGRVAEAKTRLVQAKNDLERYKPLAEIDAISKKDLDAAEANYGAAQAALEAANASLQSAKIQLGYTKIKAPISGIIGKSQAKIGDYVGGDLNSSVLNAVSRIDTILVDFFIPESRYLELMRFIQVKEDMVRPPASKRIDLTLMLADGTEHKYKGKVNFVNRQVEANTGSILVQAIFPNPERILRPGQFAKVRGPIDNIKDAMLVPQKAVSELQGQYRLFVLSDSNTVYYQKVEVGETLDDMWLIREGISTENKIVYEGLLKIQEGQKVNPLDVKFESVNPKNN